MRNDDEFTYVAAWAFRGESSWELFKEPLEFEVAKPTQRSYK
jgi:succinate dehydrogenase / fumarate reductase flavoprotein subunit